MLWLALLCPSLPLAVFARGAPLALQARPFVVSSGGHVPRVVAANAAGHAAGLRDGQLLSAALALAPDLVAQDRDPAAEAAALAQLATLALGVTPAASLAPPDAIVADIGASLRLFGGQERIVARLLAGAQALGYPVRPALAPTPAAALAFARSGVTTAVDDPRALAAALSPLPLACFAVPETARITLAAAGVTTFGATAALPRAGLARRFGPALVAALDRAEGRRPDPRPPFVPPPRFASKLELPAPVHDAAMLAFALHRLVQELCAWLLARRLGVVRVTLALAHERALVRSRDSPCTEAGFALAAPTRTPAHLAGVLRERLAQLALPAPVAGIALASEATAPLASRNTSLLPGEEAADVEQPLVDRLRARLGEDAVRQVRPHADHRPERAAKAGPTAGADSTFRRDDKPAAEKSSPTPLSAPSSPRPLWLLAKPQPLAALGEAQPWVLREGPERIESGWWDGADVRRDYFVAESPQGEIAWIFRDHRRGAEDGDWFLHGIFA